MLQNFQVSVIDQRVSLILLDFKELNAFPGKSIQVYNPIHVIETDSELYDVSRGHLYFILAVRRQFITQVDPGDSLLSSFDYIKHVLGSISLIRNKLFRVHNLDIRVVTSNHERVID